MIDEDKMRAAYLELRARVRYVEIATGLFVPDEDLDSSKGDPVVRFGPRNWRGGDCKNMRYSECPPEFLDMLAESIQWSAENPPKEADKLEKWQKFRSANLRDAARARTWARRIRMATSVPAEQAPKSEPPPAGDLFDDESKAALPADDGDDLFG